MAAALLATEEGRRALATALLANPGAMPIEIRHQEDGLDEVVGVGAVHLERMDEGSWWMRVGDVHVNLWTNNPRRTRIHGRAEKNS
jgi:hypothetical protein